MNSLMGKVLAIHIPNARYIMKTQSTIYTEDTSFPKKKYFKVTPANNNVKYLFGARRHQYLTTSSILRDGKTNYYILPLERPSAVHLLIISQYVSSC